MVDVVRTRIFFLQAEDGIRDIGVTGVQTCALPILFAQIADAAPDHAVCDSETCRWHIEHATQVRTVHPVEMLHRAYGRSEERRVGKSVDLGGRRIIKKKQSSTQEGAKRSRDASPTA